MNSCLLVTLAQNSNCKEALATATHCVSANMDSGMLTDLIQLNLGNASGTLDHTILVTKALQVGLEAHLCFV